MMLVIYFTICELLMYSLQILMPFVMIAIINLRKCAKYTHVN